MGQEESRVQEQVCDRILVVSVRLTGASAACGSGEVVCLRWLLRPGGYAVCRENVDESTSRRGRVQPFA